MPPKTHRRNFLKAMGVGAAGSAIIGSASARVQSLDEQLETVRNETESLTDARQAMESGFRILGPPFRQMGWYFVNLENLQSALEGNVDLSTPVLLTYSDDLELGAVVYAVPQEEEPPSLFNDEDADDVVSEEDGWGRHNSATHVYSNGDDTFDEEVANQWVNAELTFDADSEFMELTNWVEFSPGREDMEPGDTVDARWDHTSIFTERVTDVVATHPPLNILHVWVHTENPDGTFSPTNSEFHQSN